MAESTSGQATRAAGEIRRLAIPMFAGDVVGYLQMLVLVAMMGRMGGDALYVRSLYVPLGMVFTALNAALAVSAQVACSIGKGQERPDRALPIAVSTMKIWGVLGAAVTLVLSLGAPALAWFFDVSPAVRDEFVWFLRWMSVVSLLGFGPAVCASALRGFGFARKALVLSLVTIVVEVVVVGGLVLGTDLKIASLPIAAAAAAVAGSLAGLRLLRTTDLYRPGQRAPWDPEITALVKNVGVPVAATLGLISLYSFGAVWVLGPFGEHAVAGFSTAYSVQTLILMPALVLGSATAIVLNQRRGAGAFGTLRPVYRDGVRLSLGVYAVIALVVWLGRDLIAAAMTSDTAIAAETSRYLAIVALTYVLQGPVLVSLTLMEHIGAGRNAVLLNIFYFAANIIAGRWVSTLTGNADGLYWSIAVFNVVGLSVLVFATAFVKKLGTGGKAG